MPQVVKAPSDLRVILTSLRKRGREQGRENGHTIGFVPTMGALHEGHLALAREAKKRSEVVVCSVFVNPTQFGPGEDLARYPRDLAADRAKLEGLADIVFAPEASAMYVPGERTRVQVDGLTKHLCGPHRPGHFEGVSTIVAKLFALVGPSVAVFGKKDYQQLAVLRRMAADLFFPVEIVGHPIVREADGLAMSSRNAYLTAEERSRARSLSLGLAHASQAYLAGERRAGALEQLARAHIEPAASVVDYVTVADVDTLVPLMADQDVGARALLAVACRIGTTRLIDNVVLGEDPPLRVGGAL